MVRSLACLLLVVSGSTLLFGQGPSEMSVLKKDVGVWDCEVKFYGEPNGEPITSKAVESNHMVGEMWVIGDFKGEVAGAAFHGSSQMGYDAATKKYVGTWVDSMSPYPTKMVGTWDAASKSLTIIGTAKDPSGTEMQSKMVSAYKDNDNRTMTMYMKGASGSDEWVKSMEVIYRRKK